jgi:hypothetical protein
VLAVRNTLLHWPASCTPQELSAKQYWEELLGAVTFWMVRERAVTTGTVAVLRQVSPAAVQQFGFGCGFPCVICTYCNAELRCN